MTSESKKGQAIKFIGGSHVGCSGWINKSKDPSEYYISVIVVLKKSKEEKFTKIKHENYVLLTAVKDATNYEEAMMQQHVDIDEMLTKVVRKMAECELISVSGQDGQTIGNVFMDRLGKAIARQQVKGSKARWRRVRWSP